MTGADLHPLRLPSMRYSYSQRTLLPIAAAAILAAILAAVAVGASLAKGILLGACAVAAAIALYDLAMRESEKRRIAGFLVGRTTVALPSVLNVLEGKGNPIVRLSAVHPETDWVELTFRDDVWWWCMTNLHAPFGVVPMRGVPASWQSPPQGYFATPEDAQAFAQRWLA